MKPIRIMVVKERESPAPEPSENLVEIYFAEVGKTPLLTAEEEIEFSRTFQEGEKARLGLSQNGDLPPTQKEELERQIREGKEKRDKLIEANQRLVVSIAKHYLGLGVSLLDLIQDGNLGLIEAIKRFGPERGFRFSTYATWWIRQSVVRAAFAQSRTIRLPIHQLELLRKLEKKGQRFLQDQNREPTVEELASILEEPVGKIKQLLGVSQRPVSLEAPVGEEKDTEGGSLLGQLIEDKSTPSPPDLVANSLLRQQIEESLKDLTPREVRILQLRYGLKDGETHTLEEIGQKLGFTRERIRQIQTEALRKLRHPSRSRNFRDF